MRELFFSIIALQLFSLNVQSQTYCTAGPSSTFDSNLGAVTLTGETSSINNPTSCPGLPGLQTYLNESADLIPGETYTLSAIFGTCGGTFNGGGEAWIDFNQNGSFEPTESVGTWAGTPTFNATFIFTVPLTATIGQTRLRVMHQEFGIPPLNPCGAFTWGGVKDFRIDIIDPVQNNAGLVAVEQPTGPVCGSSGLVSVSFTNSGKVPISDLQLVWQVNRPGLPIPFPPVFTNWSGNLAPGGVINNYVLGNFQGGFQPGDILTVYTEFPNNVLDSANSDDTIKVIMSNGFGGGFFTIGDPANGTFDFADFSSAMTFVDGLEGICDSVVFTFMDSAAVYAGPKYLFKNIPGASFSKPIIFRSESRNPAQVEIIHSSSQADSNFTIGMRNARGIIFDGVTIRGGNSANGTAVKIFKNSREIWFNNCAFVNNITNTESEDAALFVISDGIVRNIKVQNTRFINGSFGIYSDAGDDNVFNSNWEFTGNTFQNQRARFADVFRVNNLKFNGNQGTSTSNFIGTNSIGFQFNRIRGNIEVIGNKVNASGLFPQTSVSFVDCKAPQSNPMLIANNMISTGKAFSNAPFVGLNFKETENVNFVYNTFYTEGLSPTSASLRTESGGGVMLMNNIFTHFGAGLAVNYATPTVLAGADYNNLYSKGANIARYGTSNVGSLAILRNSVGLDLNGLTVDPIFHNAPGNLRICNAALDSAATPISKVTIDIDGDARNTSFPDIGASEFIALDNFSLGGPFDICIGDSVQLFGSSNTGDAMLWSNGSTASSIWANTDGLITARVSNACGAAVDVAQVNVSKPVSLSTDDIHLCADEVEDLIATIGEPAQVLWNNGSTDTVITISEAGIYEVIVTNNAGCVSTASATVTKSGKANVFSDLNNDVICTGRSGFIDAGISGASYQWSGGVVSPTSQVTAISAGGIYSVIATINGCESRDTIEIGEVSDPNASFTVGSSHFTISLINTSTPSQSLNYSWDFGDGNTSAQPNPIHVYQTGNVYNVVLTVTNECGSSTANYSYAATLPGFSELDANQAISVYPNPSSGLFNISLNETVMKSDFQVIGLDGKLIESFGNLNNPARIDLSHLPAGVYLLKAINNLENAMFVKLIVQ